MRKAIFDLFPRSFPVRPFVIGLLSLAAFAARPAAAQTALFSDNFHRTSGMGANWTVLYGSYTTNGTYAVSGTPPINGNWARAVPSLGTDDYSVKADIIIPTGSVDSGVFARSFDPTNFDMTLYALKLNTDGSVNLYRRIYWDWTLLATISDGIQANVTYTTELVVEGSNPVHLEGWVNGTKLIGFDDDSSDQISTGVSGLVNYSSSVKYTNFEVDSVPAHLFFDYFDRTDGLGSNWQVAYGSFTTNGSHAVSGTPPVNGNWASVVPALGTNDYSVSADIIIPGSSLTDGIVARSSVAGYFDSDLYAAQLSTDGTVNLYRRNSWDWTLLSQVSAGIVANTAYNLKLVVSGSNPVLLEVWLNGTQEFTYSDSSASRITAGIPGVMNYDSAVDYTTFIVDPIVAGNHVTVSAALLGGGSGTVTSSPAGISCPGTCSMTVTKGTVVTFSPQSGSSSTFGGWSGACQGIAGCSVTANNNQTVFAEFDPIKVTIDVLTTGSGTVTSSPSGINCPGTCSESVAYNTTVTLTAAASSGYTFSGWTVGCSGTGTCTPATTSYSSVTANFTLTSPPTWTVTAAVIGQGTVTSTPSGINCPGTCSMTVNNGTSVSLSASPSSGFAFAGWGGACSGSAGCNFNVYSNQTSSATFQVSKAYPCNDHACARGEFPPASWRPYDATSAFNKTVPSNPPLLAGSSTMMSYVLHTIGTSNAPSNLWYPPDGSTGWPTYYGNSTSNNYSDTLSCSEVLWGTCNPQGDHFYVPNGAEVQGNNPLNDSDRHYTIIDQSQNPIREYDLWGASVSPLTSATNITTLFSGYTNVMSGDGIAIGNGQGTAGNVGNLAGRIREEEFADAISNGTFINHAIGITIKCTNDQSVYPASVTNTGLTCAKAGLTNPANAPPMGARLWLNMSPSAINLLSIPEWKKVLLRTLNKYGAIVMDTSGETSYFSWQTESGNQYLSMGATDAWQTFGASRVNELSSDWYNSTATCTPPNSIEGANCFPGYTGTFHDADDSLTGGWTTAVWNNLKVLDPCVSNGRCNP